MTPLITTIVQILTTGSAIFVLIQGLKNLPFIAPLFAKYPNVAIILNAVGALVATAITCIEPTISFTCLFTAVSVFIAAAGIHLTVKTVGGQTTTTVAKAAAAK